MRAVVQRVDACRVVVDGTTVGKIDRGLLVYLGIAGEDGRKEADYIVRKASQLRVFDDADGVMNLSVEDVAGEICVVSQFTLFGDTRKGNRPSYNRAASPDIAVPLYEYCVERFRSLGFAVATGSFGAAMKVSYKNNGPVTILIDTEKRR